MNSEPATVLVVDDTPENIDLLVEILKGDYKIKAARNGEQALKIARLAEAPDLILLDIMMPGIDGLDLQANIRTGGAQLAGGGRFAPGAQVRFENVGLLRGQAHKFPRLIPAAAKPNTARMVCIVRAVGSGEWSARVISR